MNEWTRKALELGKSAPFSIEIPYGANPGFPGICAACGEEATSVNCIDMNRGAADETVMLRLPACEACFHDNTGDWWKRKLKLGCLMVVAVGVAAAGGGGFKEDGLKLLSVVVGGILLVLGNAVGKGAGRDQATPMIRRRPYIHYSSSGMRLFASSAFILAAIDAVPELKRTPQPAGREVRVAPPEEAQAPASSPGRETVAGPARPEEPAFLILFGRRTIERLGAAPGASGGLSVFAAQEVASLAALPRQQARCVLKCCHIIPNHPRPSAEVLQAWKGDLGADLDRALSHTRSHHEIVPVLESGELVLTVFWDDGVSRTQVERLGAVLEALVRN